MNRVDRLPITEAGELIVPEVRPDLTHNQMKKAANGQPIELIHQTRTYKLITPLFGGGIEPGVPDPSRLISGKAVRGHLRFWWRATRGGEFGDDLIRLKQEEGKIWGTSSLEVRMNDLDKVINEAAPSQVQIAVSIDKKGDEDCPFEAVWRPNQNGPQRIISQPREGSKAPPYVAFPLQPDSETIRRAKQPEDVKQKVVRIGVTFTLKISFPIAIRKDVEAAIWAWETFGGVGARTRRGFGAVHLVSYIENNGRTIMAEPPEPTQAKVRERIQTGFGQHVVPEIEKEGVKITAHPHLPHLSHWLLSSLRIIGPEQGDQLAWRTLIGAFRKFRQQRGGGGRGRSKWPEPDEIRYLTNQYHPKHGKDVFDPPIRKFPRAVFGLPIIFHFKDNDSRNMHRKDCDPVDTALQFRNYDRWASQLILRPLICADRQAVAIAILLRIRSLPDGGFVLVPKNFDGELRDPEQVEVWLEQGEADDIEPLRDKKGKGQSNPIFAFLKTLD